jgi:hypothetical protein
MKERKMVEDGVTQITIIRNKVTNLLKDLKEILEVVEEAEDKEMEVEEETVSSVVKKVICRKIVQITTKVNKKE